MIEIALCERFHCLPSQLEHEDIGMIVRGCNLLDLYHALKRSAAGDELSEEENALVGRALQIEIEYGRDRNQDYHNR